MTIHEKLAAIKDTYKKRIALMEERIQHNKEQMREDLDKCLQEHYKQPRPDKETIYNREERLRKLRNKPGVDLDFTRDCNTYLKMNNSVMGSDVSHRYLSSLYRHYGQKLVNTYLNERGYGFAPDIRERVNVVSVFPREFTS